MNSLKSKYATLFYVNNRNKFEMLESFMFVLLCTNYIHEKSKVYSKTYEYRPQLDIMD